MKVCIKCRLELPASNYYRNSNYRDGIESKCKACKKATRQKNEYTCSVVQQEILEVDGLKANPDNAPSLLARYTAEYDVLTAQASNLSKAIAQARDKIKWIEKYIKRADESNVCLECNTSPCNCLD